MWKHRSKWPIALIVALVVPVGAGADERTDRLVELLTSSPSYRVRAQAAFSLGRCSNETAVVALTAALEDENEIVRAAAARSLDRINARRAARPLEEVVTDPPYPVASRLEPDGAPGRGSLRFP